MLLTKGLRVTVIVNKKYTLNKVLIKVKKV